MYSPDLSGRSLYTLDLDNCGGNCDGKSNSIESTELIRKKKIALRIFVIMYAIERNLRNPGRLNKFCEITANILAADRAINQSECVSSFFFINFVSMGGELKYLRGNFTSLPHRTTQLMLN